MKKRLLSMILCFCMVLSMLPTVVLAATSVPTTGDGTAENPYQITTVEELSWCTSSDGRTAHSVLKADLYIPQEWFFSGTAIFSGTFDGGGHTITFPNTPNSKYLFDTVTGVVRNLHVSINYTAAGGIEIGGICNVLKNGGLVENCFVSGNLTYNYDFANVRCGGICVTLEAGGKVRSCYSALKITHTYTNNPAYIGALIGYAYKDGIIENCCVLDTACANAIGSSSTYTGSGTLTKVTSAELQSGLATYLLNGSQSTEVAWYQTLNGSNPPSLDNTQSVVYAITKRDCPDSPLKVMSYNNTAAQELPAGEHDYNTATGLCKYCEHRDLSAKPDGDGTAASPYLLDSVTDLYWFYDAASQESAALCARLTADITVNQGTVSASMVNPITWKPIGTSVMPYTGTFYGDGHTISGLYCSGGELAGLFGISSGTIENVTVGTSYFDASRYLSGVCAQNSEGGRLQNCTNACTLTHEVNSAANGTVFWVGGVCAYNKGTISDCTNKGDVSGTLKGTFQSVFLLQLGGVCAENTANVTGAVNSGKVNISGSDTAGSSYKKNFYTGGVCGNNSGTVEKSTNNETITGTLTGNNGGLVSRTGGICGYNSGTLKISRNTSSITVAVDGANMPTNLGGVCGYNSNLLENCYNTDTGTVEGTITGTTKTYIGMGGVCGYSGGTLKNSYNLAQFSAADGRNVGSICGIAYNTSITESCFGLTGTTDKLYVNIAGATTSGCDFKTADQFKSGEVAYLLNGRTGGDIWYQNIDSGTADAIPLLDNTHGKVYYYSSKYSNTNCQHTNVNSITGLCTVCNTYIGQPEQGNGTAENPYQLANAKNLYWFSALIRGQEGMPAIPSAHAVLTNDISINTDSMSEGSSNAIVWTTIGTETTPFAGSLDGQGHTVSGLYLNDSNQKYVGFVGCMAPNALIKNITIANSYFNGSVRIGAICGGSSDDSTNGNGMLTNCHTLSNVKVSGSYYVGGIIGFNKRAISNCKNQAAVTADCGAGGIAGLSMYSNIKNCENSGVVSTGNSYINIPMWSPNDDKPAGSFTGGIVGAYVGILGSTSVQISNCRNSGTISSESSYANVAGIAGAISNNCDIINCYNSGATNAPNSNGCSSSPVPYEKSSGVGGIVGTIYGQANTGAGSVNQCHNVGKITGKNNVGGVVGSYLRGVENGTENCFSLEGTANEVVSSNYPNYGTLNNVSFKTAEEFQNGSLIDSLNNGGAVWEQGLTYPIFLRTEVVVSDVSVLGKTYDGNAVSYSGTPMATLNAVSVPVAGYTYTWKRKETDNTYSNLSGNAAPKNAGSYRLVVSVSGAEPNYSGSQNIDFTIAPKTISNPTIVLEESSYSYTGEEIKPSVIVKDGETVIPADQYTVSYQNNIAVGNANVNIMENQGANYSVSGSTSFSIMKAGGPAAPNFSAWDDDKNTFTFVSTNGTTYQWRINDGEWSDILASGDTTAIPVGNVIVPAGKLEVRMKATDTHEVSGSLTNTSEQVFTATLEGSVSINNTAPSFGDTLTANVSSHQGNAVFHYQWKAGNVNVGADASTYTVQSSDIGKTIMVLVTAAPYEGSLTSAATSAVTANIPGAHDANKLTRYIDTSNQTVSADRFGIKMKGTFTANGVRTDSGNIVKSVEYGVDVTFTVNGGLSFMNQTASIPLLFTPEDSNYAPKALILTVTLTNKEPLEITGLSPATNLIYNGSPQSGYTGTAVVSDGKVPANELVYTYIGMDGTSYSSNVAPTDAGSYKLLVSIPDDNANYISNECSISFRIAKKPVTVKVDDKSMITGGVRPPFTVTYTGFVGTENENNAALATPAAVSCSADGYTAGTFAISITTQAILNNTVGRNYTITSQSGGTLTVQTPSSGGNNGGNGGSGDSGGSVSKVNYKLSFETNGGSIISDISKESGTTLDIASYIPTRDGYDFDGWYADKALTEKVTSVKLTKNTTVYAKWTEKPAKVVNPFTDVSENAYYHDAVLWAVEKDVTSGTTNTTFSPDMICTRAQMITFLWRAMGSPEPTSANCPFTDVSKDAYYYKAILWAVEKGITAGTSSTTFSPNATVTRGQSLTFMWCAAGKPAVTAANPFTDVTNKDVYYYNAMLWAVENGITKGTSARAFSPNAGCTRSQIVTFLYKYVGK